MAERRERRPEVDDRAFDDYGGRRPTDAELAERFMVYGGFTETEAWAAVRFVRGSGSGRGRGRRRPAPRRGRTAA